MILKDNFSKFTNISKLSGCIAFFTNEKLEITHLKKYLSSSDYKNLTVLLKNKNKKKGLLSFDLNPNQKIILVSLKKNQKSNETEKSGAKLTDFLKSEGAEIICITSAPSLFKKSVSLAPLFSVSFDFWFFFKEIKIIF